MNSDQEMSGGKKVGIAFAVIIVLSIIIGVGVYFYLKNKSTSSTSTSSTSKYVPGSAPTVQQIKGRYIKLENPINKSCYNMAEIKVFSSPTGPDIITKDTKVTASSTLKRVSQDDYPGSNMVDGNLDTFAHTSCDPEPEKSFLIDLGSTVPIDTIKIAGDVPWTNQIIGTVLSVLDSNMNVVYTANPIPSKDGIGEPNDGMDNVFRFNKYVLPSKIPIGTDAFE